MLWLAVHLPRFAVEVCAARAPAVTVTGGRVVAVDGAAEAAGIGAGMRLSSALGLAPGLTVCDPDPRGQVAALEMLGCWAGSFSPHVSLAPPDEVLLEIGGCVRLFGGLPALLREFEAGCAAHGFSYRLGLAATPLGAQWLARAGLTAAGRENGKGGEGAHNVATALPELRDRLAVLPVHILQLDERPLQRLAVLGLRRIGELLELPPSGLARRFGPDLPLLLARALGMVPDPRPAFAFPQRFAQKVELPARVERADMLLFAARRLLLALAGWLHARSAGVRACALVLIHDDAPPTCLTLGFAAPTRDAERLLRVLRERIERLVLVAPVSALRVDADAPEDLPGTSAGLFAEAGVSAIAAIAPVVERLRARLGDDAVQGLGVVPDHRPECASSARAWPAAALASRPAPPIPSPLRPLGLLPTPRALSEHHGGPWHDGRLRLLTRAERIESGWWDAGEGAGDVRRDYFVAVSPAGQWLWVFRDRRGWWLHGLFA